MTNMELRLRTERARGAWVPEYKSINGNEKAYADVQAIH